MKVIDRSVSELRLTLNGTGKSQTRKMLIPVAYIAVLLPFLF